MWQVILSGHFLDAIELIRQLAVGDESLDNLTILSQRTRWRNESNVTIQMDADLKGKFRYLLVIGPFGDPPRARIWPEELMLEPEILLRFPDIVRLARRKLTKHITCRPFFSPQAFGNG